MAYMFPEKPKDFSPYSLEDIMFDALAKLPDDYYVFHSFSIVSVIDNVIHESETDFVIFNPYKGLLCLEAKAGKVKYRNGRWFDGNEVPMGHDGPFNQAASNKWKISKYIDEIGLSEIKKRCKMLHAVWFPSVSKEKFIGVSLPSEADRSIMLTSEALDNITESIENVFNIGLPNGVENNMSQNDVNNMLNRVLAPSFDLVSIPEIKMEHRRMVFKRMLKEQVALLNYLEEQKTAVINGLAGTGKTVMAVKKAQLNAGKGEKVLFLCYNAFLKDSLKEGHKNCGIDFYTIDGLACKLCNTDVANYELLKNVLEDMYLEHSFPFKHVVIDEGQDFGRDSIHEAAIIDLIRLNVFEENGGSFYLFYDKNQMIQSERVPDYIAEADCKLTLYRNCRNTENIAITSLRLLGKEEAPKLFEGAIVGDSPDMYFSNGLSDTVKDLNYIIDQCWDENYDDIQILTSKTEESSIIADECSTGVYLYKGKKIPFTTCRKYKGLEADAVILVDIDNEALNSGEQILYVGSSRARFKLAMIANISSEDFGVLLAGKDMKKVKKPEKLLATSLNAKYREVK